MRTGKNDTIISKHTNVVVEAYNRGEINGAIISLQLDFTVTATIQAWTTILELGSKLEVVDIHEYFMDPQFYLSEDTNHKIFITTRTTIFAGRYNPIAAIPILFDL